MAEDPKEQKPPATPAGDQPAPPAISGTPSEAKPPAPAGPEKSATPPGASAPPAGGAPPKPAAPKAPAIAATPLDNDLVKRYRARFGEAIREATEDRKQAILLVDRERLVEIAQYTRDEEKFDLLSDLTAVDWPKREKRFDVVLNLYSFAHNVRLRIKVHAADGEKVPSVFSVWPTANWLEREVYDMFGIEFAGHPDLKRILLPDEWQGFPLRKDYDILKQDDAWVKENLGISSEGAVK
ncbi:MAG: NADH-quinone oxidoreductase subunit C [Candidatus Acidiferrales bacterium]|jgi:NADH-quinone oxidoreductase subunit C